MVLSGSSAAVAGLNRSENCVGLPKGEQADTVMERTSLLSRMSYRATLKHVLRQYSLAVVATAGQTNHLNQQLPVHTGMPVFGCELGRNVLRAHFVRRMRSRGVVPRPKTKARESCRGKTNAWHG